MDGHYVGFGVQHRDVKVKEMHEVIVSLIEYFWHFSLFFDGIPRDVDNYFAKVWIGWSVVLSGVGIDEDVILVDGVDFLKLFNEFLGVASEPFSLRPEKSGINGNFHSESVSSWK